MQSEIQEVLAELATEIRLEELDIERRVSALTAKRGAFELLQSRITKRLREAGAGVSQAPQTTIAEPAVVRTIGLSEAVTLAVKNMRGVDIYVAPVYDAIVKKIGRAHV